jgi:transcriptional accessory protein Tex/SPT6
VVKVQQRVTVTVLSVDLERTRVSLSMRSNPGQPRARKTQPPRPASRPARPAAAKRGEPPPPRRAPGRARKVDDKGKTEEATGGGNWLLGRVEARRAHLSREA